MKMTRSEREFLAKRISQHYVQIANRKKSLTVNYPEVKFKRQKKFEPKILMWIAISENGISTPFFAQQKQAVNQTTYLNNCIKPHLMPFIKQHHHKRRVLFWPDLAKSHYGLQVRQYLEKNGIQFVPEQKNPQNCPQARPIETFWSILEQRVYGGGWEAKNFDELQERIKKKLKEIDINVVKTMFSNIRKQLRQIARQGPYGACSF